MIVKCQFGYLVFTYGLLFYIASKILILNKYKFTPFLFFQDPKYFCRIFFCQIFKALKNLRQNYNSLMSGRKPLSMLPKNQNEERKFEKPSTGQPGLFNLQRRRTNLDSNPTGFGPTTFDTQPAQPSMTAEQWDEVNYQRKIDNNIKELNNLFQNGINEFHRLQTELEKIKYHQEKYSVYAAQLAELYQFIKNIIDGMPCPNPADVVEGMVNNFEIPDENEFPEVELVAFDQVCTEENLSEFIVFFKDFNNNIKGMQDQLEVDVEKLNDTKDSIEKLQMYIKIGLTDIGLVSNE